MSNKCILTSKDNKYVDHIKKIINQADYEIKVIDELNILSLKEDDIVYSLITNNLTLDIYKFNYLINKEFYSKKLNKKDIQIMLIENNVNTPKILKKVNVYPVYFKENKHEGFVKMLNNEEELFSLTKQINDFYIEEYINFHKEIKCYYIYGHIYDKNIEIFDNEILSICNNVAKILGLDIMSLDILFNDNNYYVIDVNQSPGFYLSDIARLNLIKKLKEM